MAKKRKPIPTQTEILAWFFFQKSEEDEAPEAHDFLKWMWEFRKADNLSLYYEFYYRYPRFRAKYLRPTMHTLPK